MGFLVKTVQPRPTTSSLPIQQEAFDESQVLDSSVEVPVQHTDVHQNRTKKKAKTVEDKFMEYLEVTTKQKSQSHLPEKDEHEKFFDSLLSIVRQFDEDQSLMFRAEVIKLIQKVKRGSTYSSIEYQQPRSQHHYESSRYYHPVQNYHLPSSAPSPSSSSSPSPQVLYQPNTNIDDQTFTNGPYIS